MESNNKLFRSAIYQINGISNTSKFNFSLQLPSNNYKFIELISYGIHSTGTNDVHYLNLLNLFDTSLIVHSTNNFQFLNFCHGLIQSINNQSINNILECSITPPIINAAVDDELYIVLYFIIHY